MIRMFLALCLLTTTPALAVQTAPSMYQGKAPVREVPKEQPPRPVGIIPRNRRYEALLAMLLDNRKSKPKWHPDSGKWYGRQDSKRHVHMNRRVTKRSSAKW